MDHVERESRCASLHVFRARLQPVSVTLPALLCLAVVPLLPVRAAAPAHAAASSSSAPLKDDARLQQTLTVRVSRMPLADLLQRVGAAVDKRLLTEGEDVADQKIDLFVKDLPAVSILTALTDLLNSEGPRGYRWERSGLRPAYRYVLVRDMASRQWEAQQASAAERRLVRLLQVRLQQLGKEPFRRNPEQARELPGMRKLLATLTSAQLERVAADRLLVLTAGTCESSQRMLLNELVAQMIAAAPARSDPETVRQRLAIFGPPGQDPRARAEVYLRDGPPAYRIRMGVIASGLGQSSDVCRVEPFATSVEPVRGDARATSIVLPSDTDPLVALPARASWLMGDVLADLAVRAGLNLIADDYTQIWPGLARFRGPQRLSVWLRAIRDDYGFEPSVEGSFLRLRNRRWWQDAHREIPIRLLERWGALFRGSADDRLQAAVEAAHWGPLAPHQQLFHEHFEVLARSPEVGDISRRFVEWNMPAFATAVARAQTELRIYDLLPASRQRMVKGAGLTLLWPETSPPVRAVFTQRVRSFLAPGLSDNDLRRSSLFLNFHDDRLRVRWHLAGVPRDWEIEVELVPDPGFDLRQDVGQSVWGVPLPQGPGATARGPSALPLLLYITPAWPRPVIAKTEEFADLRAIQHLVDNPTGTGERIVIAATEATGAELQSWWTERKLSAVPVMMPPEAAQRLGVRHQSVVLVVDRAGRVAWVKEGYAAGDEEEWRRQLERAGAQEAQP
jgi:hypothetical protein